MGGGDGINDGGAIQLEDEDVIAPSRSDARNTTTGIEVNSALEIASGVGIASAVDRDASAKVATTTPNVLCPLVVAVGVEFEHEDIFNTRRSQVGNTSTRVEVCCARERASNVCIATAINSDATAKAATAGPNVLCPNIVAVGVEFGDEDVIAPSRSQGICSSNNSASKSASDVGVATAIHGDGCARVVTSIAESICPNIVAAGVEFGDEDVIAPSGSPVSSSGTGIEVHCACEKARGVGVATAIYGDASAFVATSITESLCPEIVAAGVELDNEDVIAAPSGSQVKNTSIGVEVGCAREIASGVGVATAIHGDAITKVGTVAAEVLCPNIVAVGVEFEDEDVIGACCGSQVSNTSTRVEVNCVREPASGVAITTAINGDVSANIATTTADALCPDIVAVGVEFGDEGVFTASRSQVCRSCTGVKVNCAREPACDVGVATAIHGDASANVAGTVAHVFGPEQIS